MEYIVGERGVGKTSRIVSWCRENNGLLIVPNAQQRDWIRGRYDIDPLIWNRTVHLDSLDSEGPLAIDGLDRILAHELGFPWHLVQAVAVVGRAVTFPAPETIRDAVEGLRQIHHEMRP